MDLVKVGLWSYKQSFIQLFTPNIARNSTLEAMSLYVHYCGTNNTLPQRRSAPLSAALLYVNSNIQIILGANM